MEKEKEIKQFGMGAIFAYHLLPGIPILLASIALSNPTWGMGIPIFLSLLLAIAFTLIPIQLGVLWVTARKEGKKIREIIFFTDNKMPLSRLILWSLPLLMISGIVFVVLPTIEHSLWTIFDWVPDWLRIDRFSAGSSSNALIWIIIILGFIFNGVLGPFVEELYFRGFLLPRMSRLGKSAPLVNAILFSLYHLFTPWENITRILATTPYIYAVWHKKNIRIGIIVHVSLNIIGMVMMAIGMLK